MIDSLQMLRCHTLLHKTCIYSSSHAGGDKHQAPDQKLLFAAQDQLQLHSAEQHGLPWLSSAEQHAELQGQSGQPCAWPPSLPDRLLPYWQPVALALHALCFVQLPRPCSGPPWPGEPAPASQLRGLQWQSFCKPLYTLVKDIQCHDEHKTHGMHSCTAAHDVAFLGMTRKVINRCKQDASHS